VEPLIVTQDVVIPPGELSWSASRSSGPGGQNVNKVSSKVLLRFDLEASCALREPAKARLRRIAASYLEADGAIVLVCQEDRSQLRNLERARERLAELVRQSLVVPRRRRPTKPTAGSRAARLRTKHHVARVKAGRGRVRDDD
jgi:ribosome-associated protein